MEKPQRSSRHRFHTIRISEVVDETPQARSFLLAVPPDCSDDFSYRAGQFLTVRVPFEGAEQLRCYSMSSAPATDKSIKITVKRQPGGRVSNWMHDELSAGDDIDVLPPGGRFTLREGTPDIVAFASGSGITPVISIIKSALATTDRKVRLYYANSSRDSVIFAEELAALATIYRHRFSVVHHLYEERGFLVPSDAVEFLRVHHQPDVYVCGSRRFTKTVVTTLAGTDVPADRIFVESFTPGGDAPESTVTASDAVPGAEHAPDEPPAQTVEVVVKLRGRRHRLAYTPGHTLLETARRGGLSPPFSCESGTCASCMALLTEGTVTMAFNSALAPEEVDEGWVLTCQGHPTSESVVIEYQD